MDVLLVRITICGISSISIRLGALCFGVCWISITIVVTVFVPNWWFRSICVNDSVAIIINPVTDFYCFWMDVWIDIVAVCGEHGELSREFTLIHNLFGITIPIRIRIFEQCEFVLILCICVGDAITVVINVVAELLSTRMDKTVFVIAIRVVSDGLLRGCTCLLKRIYIAVSISIIVTVVGLSIFCVQINDSIAVVINRITQLSGGWVDILIFVVTIQFVDGPTSRFHAVLNGDICPSIAIVVRICVIGILTNSIEISNSITVVINRVTLFGGTRMNEDG